MSSADDGAGATGAVASGVAGAGRVGVDATGRRADRRDASETRSAVEALLADPPPPLGEGDTGRRWRTLSRWARRGSVSVARLAEAQLDAEAICDEAGVATEPGLVYGVWASAETSTQLSADRCSVSGTKPFCSGAGLVDRALVSTRSADGSGSWLAVVDTTALDGDDGTGSWTTPALADTFTSTVTLRRAPVIDILGGDRWYLERPGFWHGAIGPAACWAGAATGLIDAVATDDIEGDDRLAQAARGELEAHRHLFETLLQAAGDATDAEFDDRHGARRRALATRHLIERAATAVADRCSQSFGPRPFVTSAEVAQRHADLHLYVRQHHAERDLATLGAAVGTSTSEPGRS